MSEDGHSVKSRMIKVRRDLRGDGEMVAEM